VSHRICRLKRFSAIRCAPNRFVQEYAVALCHRYAAVIPQGSRISDLGPACGRTRELPTSGLLDPASSAITVFVLVNVHDAVVDLRRALEARAALGTGIDHFNASRETLALADLRHRAMPVAAELCPW